MLPTGAVDAMQVATVVRVGALPNADGHSGRARKKKAFSETGDSQARRYVFFYPAQIRSKVQEYAIMIRDEELVHTRNSMQ